MDKLHLNVTTATTLFRNPKVSLQTVFNKLFFMEEKVPLKPVDNIYLQRIITGMFFKIQLSVCLLSTEVNKKIFELGL